MAALYKSKLLRRASKDFQRPDVALSAGWFGGGKVFLSMVVATPLVIVVLSGSSCQMVSETTSESNPCGNMSTHDDPASSYTCRSNSAKCCLGLSSSDWNGSGDAIKLTTTVECAAAYETRINSKSVVVNL